MLSNSNVEDIIHINSDVILNSILRRKISHGGLKMYFIVYRVNNVTKYIHYVPKKG